jgi:pyridoxine 5-phosphate synthase
MSILFVRLDHLAGLRQAGGARDPDPVVAAALAELAGAGGVSLSLGRESSGTQERDLRLLRETVRTILNVCLPLQEEWVKLSLAIRPDLVTLTAAGREGPGTERGLDAEDRRSDLEPVIETLRSGGIAVGVLVDPAPGQIKAAHRAGASMVLLHTGPFCWAGDASARATEFERLTNAARMAGKLGLAVHAGGGLGYQTVGPLAEVREIEAVHVGHALVARAALVGVAEAVRELLRMLRGEGGGQ